MLVPVFRDDEGELRLLLVQRGEGGIHGGQLGLPGGKQEPDDATLRETALRETEEEIGLPRTAVEIITALEPFDTRVSGFLVHPYLARIAPSEPWRLAAGEIVGVLTPPVAALADPAQRSLRDGFDGVRLEDGSFLWGVTLRILDPLLPRLLAGEWTL